ncbi:Imm1 family immunity protein [Actinokineospora diospyrosa]|uniref:Immunity protein Imm1 n=1 Tax=Actinokineospora diospyrosa TaxID=103728 RepID=A0ABT1IGP3_9PSEU|nr:Imm1 family immunity protein [Actinokineospora diospyrosa]MCP2271813.1 Immunity protein Imm1 [Actinokineospora diospyrosa]
MTDDLLRHAWLHVDQLPAHFDLVAALREVKFDIPSVWVIATGSTDFTSGEHAELGVGVNGDIGALDWIAGEQRLVPLVGTNAGWKTYYLAGLDETPVPPHAEVPIEVAYQALAEFLTTRARPTCIEWQEAEQE